MNNCPKCGNPLQVGVTSCPICGTDINSSQSSNQAPTKEVASVTGTTNSVGQNIVQNSTPTPNVTAAPQPVTPQAQEVKTQPVQSVQQPQNVANNKVVTSVSSPVPASQNGTASVQSNPQAIAGTANPQGQNVNNQTVSSNNVSVAPQNQTPTTIPSSGQQATPTPINNQVNVTPVGVQANPTNPITPTVEGIVPTQNAPVIPASLNQGQTLVPEVQSLEAPKTVPEKTKKSGKSNKTIMLVGAVLIILIVATALYMTVGKSLGKKKTIQEEEDTVLAVRAVASNGFKFDLQDGWLLSEDGNNVIITNSTDSVAIRLSESATNIADLTEDIIKKQIERNNNFSNTEVTTTQISARDAYVVNTTLNETLPVQIYFIGGTSTLTLGVTVIYQSNESKTKYEPNIIEMIGTISYSDESIKAISTIGMYSEAFNLYNNIVTNKEPEVDASTDINEENTDENNENTQASENDPNTDVPTQETVEDQNRVSEVQNPIVSE